MPLELRCTLLREGAWTFGEQRRQIDADGKNSSACTSDRGNTESRISNETIPNGTELVVHMGCVAVRSVVGVV